MTDLQKLIKQKEKEKNIAMQKWQGLCDEVNELYKKNHKAEEQEALKKAAKKIHVGDIFKKTDDRGFHRDAISVYEILSYNTKTGEGKYRIYRVRCDDFEYSTVIEKVNIRDVRYLLNDLKDTKKISKKEFEELQDIFLNPDKIDELPDNTTITDLSEGTGIWRAANDD